MRVTVSPVKPPFNAVGVAALIGGCVRFVEVTPSPSGPKGCPLDHVLLLVLLDARLLGGQVDLTIRVATRS